MTEMNIQIQTDKPSIDPAFFEILDQLAEQYGLRINSNLEFDSAQLVRQDRDEHDQRDAERAAALGGLRKDLSHLEPYRPKP